MRTYSATSRRLALAFGALVALFATASFLTLKAVHETHDLAHLVKRQAAAGRLAIDLGSAVRDQYTLALQAILADGTEPSDAQARARHQAEALAATLSREVATDLQREDLNTIARASAELDRLYRDELVTAIIGAEGARIRATRAQAENTVAQVQPRVDHLAASFGGAIARFDDHAGLVQHSSFLWTVGALAASIVFAIAIGVYINRSVAHPVARLMEGAVRVGAGDLTTRIEVGGADDEFSRLAQQFNRMTSALRDKQALLIESEKLAGIGRLAAGVAHELNNPLGVILGYAKVLRRDTDGQLHAELQIIEDETVRCKEIVEGLLNLARPRRVASEPVPLRELCADVTRRLRQSGLLTGVDLELVGDATVRASSDGVRQIVVNLLTNAAQAAGVGGRISIRIERDRDCAHVSVCDTGPGLAEVDRSRLFEPFFTTKPSGTGLGLAVSRSIAEAHGGELAAECVGPGATFTLRLPLHQGGEP